MFYPVAQMQDNYSAVDQSIRGFFFAGQRLVSTFPMPELFTISDDEIPVFLFIYLRMTPSSMPTNDEWIYHSVDEHGKFVLSIARKTDGYLLRFPNLADFIISEDGLCIDIWPEPGVNEDTYRHLLLDQVLPRLLSYQGRLVLHASAVDMHGQAIAFVGESGHGKSTLAASLHMAGFPLLTDDGLVLTKGEDGVLALPTYTSLRLWPDAVAGLFAETPALAPMAHYSSKQRVLMADAERAANQLLPLAALYVLAPETEANDSAITLTRLSARDACMAIISNSFQLDPTDKGRAAALFNAASDIAHCLPVFSLNYPRDFTRLPEVHAAILQQHRRQAKTMVTVHSPRPPILGEIADSSPHGWG